MDIIVNGEELIKYVSVMLNYIEEYMDEISVIDKLKEELIWESKARDIVIDKYDEIVKKYFKFAKNLFQYISFIYKMLDNYSNGLQEIKEQFDQVENKFNNFVGDENVKDKSRY